MRGRPIGIRSEFWISVRKIQPERGDILKTRLESEERKSKFETGIEGGKRRGFETDIDRPQVAVLEGNWLGGRDSNPDNVVQSHVSYR
jgi:hypothetical protein